MSTHSALTAEGLVPSHIVHSMLRRGQGHEDFTIKTSALSKIASRPIDMLAVQGTDQFLKAIDLLRTYSIPFPLLPWERWQQQHSSTRERLTQKQMAVKWLSDSIFPRKILLQVESLSPGIGNAWLKYFEGVAEEYLYAPIHRSISAGVGSAIDGAVSMSSQWIIGVNAAKALSPLVLAGIEVSSDQFLNRIWGMYGMLAADLRGLFVNQPDIDINVDVNNILDGSVAEIDSRLSQYALIATIFGLNLGVASVSLPTKGIRNGLIDAGISTVVTSLASLLTLRYLPKALGPASSDFGEISAQITRTVKGDELWKKVEPNGELSEEFLRLMQLRYEVTQRKNVAFETAERTLPAWVALLVSQLSSSPQLAGFLYLATLSLRESFKQLSTHMTKQSRKKNKAVSAEALTRKLEVLSGIWGNVTYDKLLSWQNPEAQDAFASTEVKLELVKLGLPTFTNNEGATVSAISFPNTAVRSGQVVIVAGGNGSGKGVFLNTLAGNYTGDLEQTDVTINGFDLRSIPVLERRKRFILLSSLSENFNLRLSVATVLHNYQNRILSGQIPEARLKRWVMGNSHDDEIESAVCNYINSAGANITIDRSWFDERKPSGFQRTTLAFLLYFSINEPVVLLFDEIEGSMTEVNLNQIAQVVEKNISQFPGILFLAPNKWYHAWLRLPQTTAVIDMRESLTGFSLHSAEYENTIFQQEVIAELQRKVDKNEPLTIEQFSLWFKHTYFNPINEVVDENTQKRNHSLVHVNLLYTIGLGDDRWFSAVNNYLLTTCLPSWQDQVTDVASCHQFLQIFEMLYPLLELYYPGYWNLYGRQGSFNNFWTNVLSTPTRELLFATINTIIFPIVKQSVEYILSSKDQRSSGAIDQASMDHLCTCEDIVLLYCSFLDRIHRKYLATNPLELMDVATSPNPQQSDQLIPINRVFQLFETHYSFSQRIDAMAIPHLLENKYLMRIITLNSALCEKLASRLINQWIPQLTSTHALECLRAQLLAISAHQLDGKLVRLWDRLNSDAKLETALSSHIASLLRSAN